jgi:preprotein translocase subunit YajC
MSRLPTWKYCQSIGIIRNFRANFWYTILPFILVGLMVYHLVQRLDRNDRKDDEAEHSDG